MPSRGFQSSVDYTQTIGLGKSGIDSVTINWPDRSITTLKNLSVNQSHIIDYAAVTKRPPVIKTNPQTIFEQLPSRFDKHKEDDYIDFYFEKIFRLCCQG